VSGDRGEVSRLVALRYWPAGLAAATVPLLAAWALVLALVLG